MKLTQWKKHVANYTDKTTSVSYTSTQKIRSYTYQDQVFSILKKKFDKTEYSKDSQMSKINDRKF